jgi:hypothetical protein
MLVHRVVKDMQHWQQRIKEEKTIVRLKLETCKAMANHIDGN